MEDFSAWIGRTERSVDVVSPTAIRGLAALLDYATPPWGEDVAPPLAHWLHFLRQARQSEIGSDGHPERGGFLPPVALPRRMWAGGRLDFHAPLPFGAPLERISTIAAITNKRGASGDLVFITVRHEISVDGGRAIVEEQDIVYREDDKRLATPAATAPPSPARVGNHERQVALGPVQLFRYSALTFNGHRIHYDRDYARDVEGYGGLVVQGPFIATLLMDHLQRVAPSASIRRFSFRARKPLLDSAPFTLCCSRSPDGVKLWTRDQEGAVTMEADAILG